MRPHVTVDPNGVIMDDPEIQPDEGWTIFAEGKAGCPGCGQPIPVPVLARTVLADDGSIEMETKPDMAELWSHAWTCGRS
jgi:hypothetical protein